MSTPQETEIVKTNSDLFPIEAVNQIIFSKMKNQRQRKRAFEDIAIPTQRHCTTLVNRFFKFFESNREDKEAQEAEIIKLNKVWCDYIKKRYAIYNYPIASNYFLQRLHFLGQVTQQMLDENTEK